MAIYSDYCTLTDIHTYVGSTATGQDALYLSLIRSVSRDMESLCGGRWFYPLVQTRYFDLPSDFQLDFDDDLLAVTTMTNGDGVAVAGADYNLLPYNATPYYALQLKASAAAQWEPDTDANLTRAISVLGLWGWHNRYAHAWPESGAVLAAAIVSTSATTTTCTTGIIHAGDMLLLDSEQVYVSAVTVAASDTLTIVRGVNGTTAATHLISAPLYRWYHPDIQQIAVEAVVALEKLKNNPVGESVILGGGAAVQTPKDLRAWMLAQLRLIGATRSY